MVLHCREVEVEADQNLRVQIAKYHPHHRPVPRLRLRRPPPILCFHCYYYYCFPPRILFVGAWTFVVVRIWRATKTNHSRNSIIEEYFRDHLLARLLLLLFRSVVQRTVVVVVTVAVVDLLVGGVPRSSLEPYAYDLPQCPPSPSGYEYYHYY